MTRGEEIQTRIYPDARNPVGGTGRGCERGGLNFLMVDNLYVWYLWCGWYNVRGVALRGWKLRVDGSFRETSGRRKYVYLEEMRF